MNDEKMAEFLDFSEKYNEKVKKIYEMNCNMELLGDFNESSLLNDKEKELVSEKSKMLEEGIVNIYKKESVVCKSKEKTLVSLIYSYEKDNLKRFINLDLFIKNNEFENIQLVSGFADGIEKGAIKDGKVDGMFVSFMGQNETTKKLDIKSYMFMTCSDSEVKEYNSTCVNMSQDEKTQTLTNLISGENCVIPVEDIVRYKEFFENPNAEKEFMDSIIDSADGTSEDKQTAKEFIDEIDKITIGKMDDVIKKMN